MSPIRILEDCLKDFCCDIGFWPEERRNEHLSNIFINLIVELVNQEDAYSDHGGNRSRDDVLKIILRMLETFEEALNCHRGFSYFSMPAPIFLLGREIKTILSGLPSELFSPLSIEVGRNANSATRADIKGYAAAVLEWFIRKGYSRDHAANNIALTLQSAGFLRPGEVSAAFSRHAVIKWRQIAKSRQPNQAEPFSSMLRFFDDDASPDDILRELGHYVSLLTFTR
jgi:hypothetical protein